jgi:transcription elongation GreA/GreB family factor
MLTTGDFLRIRRLLVDRALVGKGLQLEQKLRMTPLIDSILAPFDLVTMDTEVICTDMTTEETLPIRLVYQLSPEYGNQVSVLAPLGTALLGMRLHETRTYMDREGQPHRISVDDIVLKGSQL